MIDVLSVSFSEPSSPPPGPGPSGGRQRKTAVRRTRYSQMLGTLFYERPHSKLFPDFRLACSPLSMVNWMADQ